MKEDLTFDTIPAKFCGMVEEYRLELAKKNWIDLQLDVSLPWKTIFWIHETVLISKKFWFIQWLVKENKIDPQKFREKAKFLILSNSIKYYEFLIMELSIQKNPISFLISILK